MSRLYLALDISDVRIGSDLYVRSHIYFRFQIGRVKHHSENHKTCQPTFQMKYSIAFGR